MDILFFKFITITFYTPFFSYLGHAMGGGVIAALFGIIAAFFIGLWVILYYPIKRTFKIKKIKKK